MTSDDQHPGPDPDQAYEDWVGTNLIEEHAEHPERFHTVNMTNAMLQKMQNEAGIPRNSHAWKSIEKTHGTPPRHEFPCTDCGETLADIMDILADLAKDMRPKGGRLREKMILEKAMKRYELYRITRKTPPPRNTSPRHPENCARDVKLANGS